MDVPPAIRNPAASSNGVGDELPAEPEDEKAWGLSLDMSGCHKPVVFINTSSGILAFAFASEARLSRMLLELTPQESSGRFNIRVACSNHEIGMLIA
jgi:hypothetical protein